MRSLAAWLGLAPAASTEDTVSPLRKVIAALERLEPPRAQHLARFAYLLGRVAQADRNVSPEETAAMERLVRKEGGISEEQAVLVVGLAKSSNELFGSVADFEVARDFAQKASYEEKLDLARCLFAVAASDESISMSEETEIHRILTQLRIEAADLTALRIAHRRFLPGLSDAGSGD